MPEAWFLAVGENGVAEAHRIVECVRPPSLELNSTPVAFIGSPGSGYDMNIGFGCVCAYGEISQTSIKCGPVSDDFRWSELRIQEAQDAKLPFPA